MQSDAVTAFGPGDRRAEPHGSPSCAGRTMLIGGPPAAPVIEAAFAAIERGEVDVGRTIVKSVLEVSEAAVGARTRAQALACLAHCDRVLSKPSRAIESAREAAQLFEELGDTAGEAAALTTLAHVALLIGRNEEALEAALLSVELCDTGIPTPQTLVAYNVLGLAYCWAGDHARADASLEAAIAVAPRCSPEVSVYQPRINQLWVESCRLVEERYLLGRMQGLDRLGHLMADCRRLALVDAPMSVVPGLREIGRTIALASASLFDIWSGEFDAASRSLQAAAASLPANRTWLHAFVHWCGAELAWAHGDWPVAERRLVDMRETALAVEHVRLACGAELLLAQAFERQGKQAEAGDAYRSLRRRESQARVDGIGGRRALVAWGVRARRSERRLEQALVASRQFERWSFEDALTGIANRRHFERRLDEQIGPPSAERRRLSVAMVDVDDFKRVNDRFTHSVGDRVLKTVAAILTAHVGPLDLPARWAGDEFVILFDGATAAEAEPVCQRIRDAVLGFDWQVLAESLAVSVSIGVSEVGHGDSAASVMQRSDESMYRQKTPPRAEGGSGEAVVSGPSGRS